jgi:hypothetical protein
MTKTFNFIGTVVLLAVALIQPATAGSVRCGTHIISSGPNNYPGMYEVL